MGIFANEYGDPNVGRIGCAVAGIGLLFAGSCVVGNNLEYSNGTRVGVINKFSHRGLIWKTWEGQLALEGIVSGGGRVGANVWNFSLDNNRANEENIDELSQRLNQYLNENVKVKVTYHEPLTTWPWRSGTDYLVQSVEPVKQGE